VAEDRAPRIAFLGFCDRAETITKGHHVLWHENIIGLSRSRVFFIFPVNLRGHRMATAVFRPRVGDEFTLVFRCPEANNEFEIKVGISSVTLSTRPGSTDPADNVGIEEYGDGWIFHVDPLSTDVIVFERGVYKIYLSSDSGEICLGEATFWNAEVPQYSIEDVAAIRSNPFGMKIVRAEYRCKVCGGSLRVYAALEQNEKLDAEGWIRNIDLREDRFRCECGAHDFSLEPIKKGLHGFLRESFDKATGGPAGPTFSSVRLYEDSALAEHCRQYRELIDSNPTEEKVQSFLETHEIFFSTFVPQKLMAKPRVLTKYFADFAILNERKELLLIELERPGMQLLRKNGVITSELQHAFSQVQDWFQVFDDHRAAALNALGLNLDDVAKVRGIVVAGRTPIGDAEARQIRSERRINIEFYTHDDLLRGVTGLIRQVSNV
jgi:hypothetical protein